jgi:nucleotide-binding universal stress UspA family protein
MKGIQRILVPTDFSAGAAAAAAVAAELARGLGAAVDVLTVIDSSNLKAIYGEEAELVQRIGDARAQARLEAQQFADRHFKGMENVAVHARDGNVFLEVLQAAHDLRSDMIVMGTHGRTGLTHLLIGSVAEKVVRKSRIPVLTVRQPREPA